MWAIHDRYFASRPPDWPSLTHRLQLIAEETVGSALRREQAKEDAAFNRAKQQAPDAPR